MHALNQRTREESGFVIVAVLLMIVVILLLGAALVGSSVLTSSHGTKDYAQKQALAAADAGVEAAKYRLSNQEEDTSAQQKECFTTTYVAASGGHCAGQTDSLGNGEEYTYYASPALSESEKTHCAGLWVVPPTGKELYQRCITSIGKAHGATARVQERVADILTKSGSTSIFPSNGIFSYSSLEFTNKVKLSGEIGARTKVISNQEIENGGTLTTSYGTEAKVTCKPACPQSKLSSEQLASSQYNYPSPSPNPYAESQASNNNANMTISSGSINAKRELVLASAGTITIPAGTYNLCKISFSGEMTIKYTPPVKLYVDSPERKTGVPASNCSSGTGQVEMTNKIHWEDQAASKKAADLQIYVWGNPAVSPPTSSSTTFKFNGAVGGPLYAQIYAPYSAVSITNTLNMVGAMAGGWVKMTNQVEVTGEGGGSSSESSGAKTGAQFYATSYHVCPPTYSGEDAASGCY